MPQGNPDRLPTRHANVWLRYPIGGVGHPRPRARTSPSTRASTPPPPTPTRTGSCRSTPPARSSDAGRFGALHDAFYTTTGVDTPVAAAATFGQEIAAELREAQVGAVILTGT